MKKLCILALLCTAGSITPFRGLSNSMVNDIKSFCDKEFAFEEPSQEVREKIKIAAKQLEKITHEIKEDGLSVTILFKGFTGLSKDQVKIALTESGWLGTICLKEGVIEIFINAVELKVTSRVEIEKGIAAPGLAKSTQKVEKAYYTHSEMNRELFGAPVDANSLRGELKPKELILTLQKYKATPKPKEEILHLS